MDETSRADIRLVMPLIEKTDQIIALAEPKCPPVSDRVIGTTLDRRAGCGCDGTFTGSLTEAL